MTRQRTKAVRRAYGTGASGCKRRYADAVEIHLNGEAPLLGSGRRHVIVLSIGRKWARIADAATGLNTARLRRQDYERGLRAAERS